MDILQVDTIWAYKIWAVKALAAMGRKTEAIRCAESSRGPWTPDGGVDAICEEILLSSGLIEEAYEQYGLRANLLQGSSPGFSKGTLDYDAAQTGGVPGPWVQPMRDRPIVHVAGPPACGKTTFVESVLGATGGLLIAARCVRDDTCRHARETAPKTHPELRRYRGAGASGAALFVFPGSDTGSDAFFMTELMAAYSRGVILESNNPLVYVDLAVFVAPPPAAGERLLGEPDGVTELLGEIVGGPIVEFARKSPKLMEDTRARLLAGIAVARKAPQPRATQHWATSDRYSGIEHAQLVVVNVRHDSERGAAEQLAADPVRLRKEEKLFNDVLGLRGSRTPITAVVANLAQPSDPGRRKALARVRRAFRSKT
ncbi:MAG: hypothetical protein NT005_00765 [Spirochaetes bacterium]|nr:hypothetical protein [Spirochaetota bacterium]